MGGAALADNIDPKSIQKNSSISTIFGLVNSMVGGTMLLLPTLCNEAGYITGIVILSISCFISYVTCAIFTKHMKESELDIQWAIKRILGNKWYTFFRYHLYDLPVLIVQMLYSMICFVMNKAGNDNYVDPNDNKTFTFKQFSQQWVMVGTFFPIMAMLFMKNLNMLVKIAEVGVYAIYSYIIFIFYCFFNNLHEGNIHSTDDQKINLWTWNIGNLGGTAALAFTIHTSFGNMIKCNKDQSKNVRDLGWSYGIGLVIYAIISIFGGLGIINRVQGKQPSLITQFFSKENWGPFFVQFLYFAHLISVFPIFFDILKRRALPVCLGSKPASPKLNLILNIFFMCLSVGIKSIPGLKPDDITNFNGALCCFFFVYLIPIVMHLVCYHGKNSFLRKLQRKVSRFTDHKALSPDVLSNDSVTKVNTNNNKPKEISLMNDPSQDFLMSTENNQTPLLQEDEESDNNLNMAKASVISCAPHEDIEEKSLTIRLVFYGIIMLVGLAILVYGMYTIIDNFIHGKENP